MQEAAVLSRFASLVPRHGRVLHVPWAQADPSNPRVLAWVSSTLGRLGIVNIRTLSTVRTSNSELDRADAVFMGGGNTFLLLHRLRETGLCARLVDRIGAGLPCYGGSAGAIVWGSHIGTAAHSDPNDIGISDLRGLDLFGGFALWCHYHDEDDPRITQFIRKAGVSVISLSEDSGITSDACHPVAIGPGLVKTWRSSIAEETIHVHVVERTSGANAAPPRRSL